MVNDFKNRGRCTVFGKKPDLTASKERLKRSDGNLGQDILLVFGAMALG